MRPMNTASSPSQSLGFGYLPFAQVVDDLDAGERGEQLAGFVDRDLALGFDQDALAVAVRNRHADAGRADVDLVVAQDLVRLVHHLHFFARCSPRTWASRSAESG